MPEKLCKRCKEVKDTNEFYKRKDTKDGLAPFCKECFKKSSKESYQRNLEYRREYDRNRYIPAIKKDKSDKDKEEKKIVKFYTTEQMRDSHMRRNYGFSLKEYENMLSMQGEVCAICKTKDIGNDGKIRTLCVDHDHNAGIVRGLLCKKCNIALSFFQDNVDILYSAIRYLNSTSQD